MPAISLNFFTLADKKKTIERGNLVLKGKSVNEHM